LAASITFTAVEPFVAPTAPRGTILGKVAVTSDLGVEIPCNFIVDDASFERLPEGHQIRRVTSEIAGLDDALFIIEGPDLPATRYGVPLSEVSFAGWHRAIIRYR
jgi:hypothetical protein